MRRTTLTLLVSLAVALGGCGDDDRRPGGDTDAGPITVMDGSAIDEDAGTGGEDAGPVRACEEPAVPFRAELAPRCTAATKTCIEACDDPATINACVEMCIADDTTEPADLGGGVMVDCNDCIFLAQSYCLDQNGC